MSRTFSPLAIWSQVPLANRTASVIKSLQNVAVSATVAGDASSINVDTTITSVDTAKTIIIVRHRDYVPSGENIIGTISWTLSSSTNFRIAGVSNSSASDRTLTFNVTLLEYY